ncbi:MAG: hypothetical protein A2Y25_02485 [Candidatus Melainabacteria bacterium GWF2_37_15]|nr:MAG: hypothetical protein A2Y25_02485 [Candidatus Melainabacteria bacterium GWF2_37_15]
MLQFTTQYIPLRLPVKQSVNFGMAFADPISCYEPIKSNCTLTEPIMDSMKDQRVGHNVIAPEPIEAKTFTAGNNFHGQSIMSETITMGNDAYISNFISADTVDLKDNATIMGEVTVSRGLTAGHKFTAEYVEANTVNLKDGADIANGVFATGLITIDNGLHAGYLEAYKVHLKDNAVIERDAAACREFIAGNNTEIYGSVKGHTVKLGDNANITRNVEADKWVKIGNHLQADSIISSGDVSLGSIDKLNKICFDENKNTSPDRKLILNSEDIKPEKKIEVHLGDIYSLEIQTPTGNPEILNKFEFIDKSTGNPITDDQRKAIKVTRIPEASC